MFVITKCNLYIYNWYRTLSIFRFNIPENIETTPDRSQAEVGFPFYIKKLFTRKIVTNVTDGYDVVITVDDVTKTCEITLRNYVTKLRYEITLRIITWNKK
jgi:hypothetical protein